MHYPPVCNYSSFLRIGVLLLIYVVLCCISLSLSLYLSPFFVLFFFVGKEGVLRGLEVKTFVACRCAWKCLRKYEADPSYSISSCICALFAGVTLLGLSKWTFC